MLMVIRYGQTFYEKKEKVIHGIRSILVQKTGEWIRNMEKPKKI